jgi:hypothetical protein
MRKPGLFDRVFDLDKPFFHHWQKLLGIEKLLGFFQRAKSCPRLGAAFERCVICGIPLPRTVQCP